MLSCLPVNVSTSTFFELRQELVIFTVLLLSRNTGHTARDALVVLLTIQVALGVLRSLSSLSAAAKDLVDDTSVDEQVLGGEINIYRGIVDKVFGGGA
jgi:hypothetical protein